MAISPKKTKSAGSSEHPPTYVMVKNALVTLKDRKGSSRQAIIKYIDSNYKINTNDSKFKSALKRAINHAVAEGKLVKIKGSFKLSGNEKAVKKPKSTGVKKSSVSAVKKSKKPKAPKKQKVKAVKPTGKSVAAAVPTKKIKKTTKSKKNTKSKSAKK